MKPAEWVFTCDDVEEKPQTIFIDDEVYTTTRKNKVFAAEIAQPAILNRRLLCRGAINGFLSVRRYTEKQFTKLLKYKT